MGKKKPPAPPPWTLTQADLDAATDKEFLKTTTRCLPPLDIIPSEFHRQDNKYWQMVDAMYIGEPVPEFPFTFNEGFTGNNMALFIMAHLRSIEPEYEHKMAGIAYMISKIITIKE